MNLDKLAPKLIYSYLDQHTKTKKHARTTSGVYHPDTLSRISKEHLFVTQEADRDKMREAEGGFKSVGKF